MACIFEGHPGRVEYFVSECNQSTNIVKLELAKLKIADKDIILDYELKNENKKQYYNSLIRICDKALISRNRYQKLAAIDSNIVQEYLLDNN
ncbi:30068_t:CDS:2, partial [Racocetra persica]